MGRVYLTIVQAVLIFVSGSLGGFHHRVERYIMGKQPWKLANGRWYYLPLEEATRVAGLEEMDTYTYRSHNTVAQFIETRNLFYLCIEEEWRPGSQV